nr:hypothetical protein [Tanacetum cinerariifolium]
VVVWLAVDGDKGGVVITARWGVGCGVKGSGDVVMVLEVVAVAARAGTEVVSHTPYQDPQGFIYVDNKGRNRLMHSDELYSLCDGTLTGLRSSLDDITKNIRIEYLPQIKWSTLEKKRAHIMIKAIDN